MEKYYLQQTIDLEFAILQEQAKMEEFMIQYKTKNKTYIVSKK